MNASSLLLKMLTAYGPRLAEFLVPLLVTIFTEFVKRIHEEAATGKLDDGLAHWKDVIQTTAKATYDKLSGIDLLSK